MKLEVGKAYKNRKGEKVVILGKTIDPNGRRFTGDNNFYYTSDGFLFSDKTPQDEDLISEWEEPEQHTICGTYLFVRALRAFEGMTDTERKAALAYLNERWGK